jgi:hypothetical protein
MTAPLDWRTRLADQSNVICFPTRKNESIRVLEQDRYCLAHCLRTGVIPERYWDQFLELAAIIAEYWR